MAISTTPTPTARQTYPAPDNPRAVRRSGRRPRILFAKLGSFSHTNEHIREQLDAHFPGHDVETFDVKDHVKRQFGPAALNALIELMTYGPAVLANPSRRHAFFFRHPTCSAISHRPSPAHSGPTRMRFDFAIQTQGLFNGRIPGRPLLIYTDYTFLDALNDPRHDPRMFRSKTYLRYEADLYTRAEAVATTGSHVERTLLDRYGCDPAPRAHGPHRRKRRYRPG